MDSQAAIPTATVILPYVLREKAGNRKSIMVTGSTIREIVDALDHDYPGLGFNLCYETGELRRSEEHTSELQSRLHLVCRLLLEKKKNHVINSTSHDHIY